MLLPSFNLPSFDQLFSLQGILGNSIPTQGLLSNNSIVPIAALLGVWLVGGRILRLATGLVPVALMVLFMLGNDPGVKHIIGGGSGMLEGGTAAAGSLASQGWLLPACVIGGIFLLGRRRLSFIHIVLAILAVTYLLWSRDFRVSTVLHQSSSKMGLLCIGGALAAAFLYRTFSRSGSRYRIAVPIGTQIASLKPVIVSSAIGLSGIFGLFLLFQPVLIDHTFPAWRSTFGIWMLCVALYALSLSLPGRFRQWMLPAFWCVICLVIGAQITHTHILSNHSNSEIIEQF